jgi:hypothetical protein
MTSCGPYQEITNITHFWDKGDLRGNPVGPFYNADSITGILYNDKRFSRIYYVLVRAALAKYYDTIQANCTFFAPMDHYLSNIPEGVFVNMDRGTARGIIKVLTLDRRIPYELIADAPISNYHTRYPPNKLFITNVSGETYINNSIRVTPGDIKANNGIVILIEGLIWPEMDIGSPMY